MFFHCHEIRLLCCCCSFFTINSSVDAARSSLKTLSWLYFPQWCSGKVKSCQAEGTGFESCLASFFFFLPFLITIWLFSKQSTHELTTVFLWFLFPAPPPFSRTFHFNRLLLSCLPHHLRAWNRLNGHQHGGRKSIETSDMSFATEEGIYLPLK